MIRASSLISLHKPSFRTLTHYTSVFVPFSVLVTFLSPQLCFTFWHKIYFFSFNLHFVASFSWATSVLKFMFLFVYQFSFSSPEYEIEKTGLESESMVSRNQSFQVNIVFTNINAFPFIIINTFLILWYTEFGSLLTDINKTKISN